MHLSKLVCNIWQWSHVLHSSELQFNLSVGIIGVIYLGYELIHTVGIISAGQVTDIGWWVFFLFSYQSMYREWLLNIKILNTSRQKSTTGWSITNPWLSQIYTG